MDKHLEILRKTFIKKIGIISLVGVLCALNTKVSMTSPTL